MYTRPQRQVGALLVSQTNIHPDIALISDITLALFPTGPHHYWAYNPPPPDYHSSSPPHPRSGSTLWAARRLLVPLFISWGLLGVHV